MAYIAQRMRRAAERKSTRPKTSKTRSAKTKVRRNVYKAKTPVLMPRIIYLNPSTKIGRESYVSFYHGDGWAFSHGQARSTMKFHKSRYAAMEDMRHYAKLMGIKYNPGRVA